MEKRLGEEPILIISIIKLIVFATGVGTRIGGATTVFLKLLAWETSAGQAIPARSSRIRKPGPARVKVSAAASPPQPG